MTLRLDATYVQADRAPGTMRVRLVNAGPAPLSDFRLAFSSVVQLTPAEGAPTRLLRRVSGAHELAPPDGFVLAPGEVWELDPLHCGHRPGHANDGPVGAYVVRADGTTSAVRTGATDRSPAVRVGRSAPAPLRLHDAAVAGAAWEVAGACERRLHPDDAPVLAGDGDTVLATISGSGGADAFTIAAGPSGFEVTAGSPTALTSAFMALAAGRRAGTVLTGERRPVHAWRGLHIDLARQFLPAEDVGWLIDVAAWRGLNRLHLHLTDDEGWRVPIAAYPALSDVGAWRGHGHPIPPLLGATAELGGGAYDRRHIAGWVRRAAAFGIELVPEVDLPGHSFAALAAVPELRDPEDSSGAVSVQHFVDNVLNPGVAATWPLLEAVFGELADLFPGPWLHLGGDEVPAGAWGRSPAAQRYAASRGVSGTDGIAAAFVRDVADLVRRTTGRRVGAWQEAAESGALRPEDGYVVGWKSAADTRRLAAAGFDVVAAPAEAYYLDMAADADWWTPGTSWAGHVSVDDIDRFDPVAGWTSEECRHLLGIQACLWTEHVADRATLRRLLLPRLDVIAASAWSVSPTEPSTA